MIVGARDAYSSMFVCAESLFESHCLPRRSHLVEEPPGGSQVGRCEAFGEALVDLGQPVARIPQSALGPAQSGQAHGRSQFPRACLLSPCPLERLLEEFLGRGGILPGSLAK